MSQFPPLIASKGPYINKGIHQVRSTHAAQISSSRLQHYIIKKSYASLLECKFWLQPALSRFVYHDDAFTYNALPYNYYKSYVRSNMTLVNQTVFLVTLS